MCWTAVAAGVSAGASLIGGYAAGHQAEAAAKARAAQMRYEAAVAEQNAGLAELRAKQELGIAASDALVPEIAGKRIVSTMRARAGSSGLSLGKGYLTLEGDVDRYRYKAQDRIYRRGAAASYAQRLDAYSLRTTAANLEQGAKVETRLGKQAKRVAILGGVIDAVGGTASYVANSQSRQPPQTGTPRWSSQNTQGLPVGTQGSGRYLFGPQ